MSQMTPDEIRKGLAALQPETEWAHCFDLGDGIETVSPAAEKIYRKAAGFKAFADMFPTVLRGYMGRQSFDGMRCLDIGSAEGLHSITMAEGGAREVIGLDGRQLYVDRANFIAQAKGLDNVRFEVADVRTMDKPRLGQFDFVLCSGLLHHLNKEAFLDFTQDVADLTADTLLLYTHVYSDLVEGRFKLKPTDPVEGGYAGVLFREHEEKTTPEQRMANVRASLDNTYSFWAREEYLVKRLVDVGFKSIVKLYEPVFQMSFPERVFRGIWIARKTAP